MEEGSGSGSRSRFGGSDISVPVFSPTEIMEMESIFKDLREESLHMDFCLEVATGFSSTRSYGGEPVVTWQQNWFHERQKQSKDKPKVSSSFDKLPEKFTDMELESESASKKLLGDSTARPGTSRESKGYHLIIKSSGQDCFV